jgi:phage terminase large subunit-like protein
MRNYEFIALQYARDVLAGDIPACKWVKLACQRQLNDLDRFADGETYIWNPLMERDGEQFRPVDKVCRFLEQLPHVKGQWAGTQFVLEPWQIFRMACVFGWVRPDGNRRFRIAYNEVPRKNGKTFEMAGVGLYLLCADGEAGSEVYSAAVVKQQARIVFDTAALQVRKTPALREYFGVQALKHSVFIESNASMFQPLASDSDSLDGLSVHGGLIDELHAHKSREVFDVIETGTGSRAQALMYIITTAGSNQAGICYEQRSYLTKVLEGTVQDDTYWGIIYTLDADDIDKIWTDPSLLKKANPNYGVSVLPFDIENQWNKAKQTPSAQNNFLTKRANVWVNADTAWMQMHRWDQCKNEQLRLEDFEGKRCILGADLASKVDIAALCLLFEENGILYPFLRYYLPDETVRNASNDLYGGWWRDGSLTVTPGQIIDFDYIENDCRDFASRFEIAEFAYDPHQATQFAGRMINDGWNMVEVRPYVLNFSEPMKELEARTLAKTIQHNDPILTWMVSNVVGHYDAKDNIYPRKERPENKIDGVIALLSALNRYMNPGEDETSIYDKRGLRVIE